MSTVNLAAQDFLVFPANGCVGSQPQDILTLGGGRTAYLFFNAAGFPFGRPLLQARLLLFQIPFGAVRAPGGGDAQYALYPLLKPFGIFSPLFAPPAIDPNRGVLFADPRSRSCTEVDITPIVRDWSASLLENNGLLLTAPKTAPCVFIASGRYRVAGMRPAVRLVFAGAGTEVLQSAPCSVAVR